MSSNANIDWNEFWPQLDFEAAAGRLKGVVECTPVISLPSPREGVEVFGKMENRQVGRAFKARGAWNQLVQLSDAEKARGVVTASSGNHGMAVAWAAKKLGVACTICMPENSYASKIEACREAGAEVVLRATRHEAESVCAERKAAGALLIHPYNAERTIEGAGTVGLEISQQVDPMDLVILPVGGGGLAAGSSLALRRAWGSRVTIFGVEPEGAAGMSMALEAGESVVLDPVTSAIQGLTSPYAGERNWRICQKTLNGVGTLEDEAILESMARLQALGETVEPAGAAAYAAILQGDALLTQEKESVGDRPLRVLVVVSGGNGPVASE
ncbi:MAG: pyridoxal-phosphate dependent enzyme [Planctomycetes bacterium]|nr:pyridoxal-phosphate dependent enzyme [Planctomycetota bacterium]